MVSHIMHNAFNVMDNDNHILNFNNFFIVLYTKSAPGRFSKLAITCYI